MNRLLVISYLDFQGNYPGGGWVGSFIDEISKTNDYDVGVVYVTEKKLLSYESKGISYFPLYSRVTIADKLKDKVFNMPKILSKKEKIDAILNEFMPDAILLFGIETEAGALVRHIKKIPVIIHLQGILSEIVKNWLPHTIAKCRLNQYYNLRSRLFRNTMKHQYDIACKRAEVEQRLFKEYKYYLGRTDWDEAVSLKYAPQRQYFKCDEFLRAEFKSCAWKYSRGKARISTVCNGEIYKGFDNILLTAKILKNQGFDFEWNVYGVSAHDIIVRVFEGELREKFADNKVFFRGKKAAKDLAECLAQSSVFVHTSHIDNSPNAVCEAMMVGVPVVAMNVGGVSTIITDKVSGRLIEDYDCEELAKTIVELARDSMMSKELSVKAKEIAMQRHSASNILKQLKTAVSVALNHN